MILLIILIATFELDTTCDKSWELSKTLYEYIKRCMTQSLKERIFNHNPLTNNKKTAPIMTALNNF